MENSTEISQKKKKKSDPAIWSSNPTLGDVFKRIQSSIFIYTQV